MHRRWMTVPVFALAIAVGWTIVRRRPFSARLAWVLTLPGPRSIARAAQLAALLDLRPGMRVLDAGAGPGRLTIPLAEMVGPEGTVTALDVQPAMLERVRRRAETSGLRNVRLLVAELGRGTLAALEPDRYDRAVLVHVLGETNDPAATLHEIAAALRPGGRVAIVEHVGDPHFVQYRRVRAFAEGAGLRLRAERRGWLGHTTVWEKLSERPSEKGVA
ncbi:MAG: class I SAM-dependent methyltransferase [Thermomicrobium sp.]|nr:class I SAM-dependent methyltransferase [Thermomicrobium sp.]MDW7981483.1 class I SAM-dependent methyltransferase [Thermomicrobium sp.]